MAVTPYETITPDSNVPRVCRCSTIELVQKARCNIDLATYKKRSDNAGLASVSVSDVNIEPFNNVILPSGSDIVWLFGKNLDSIEIPGWNGFMEAATQDKEYELSKIVCLPFVNNPPSQYDTIYTALLIAREKSTKAGQKTCFVTFDQPLYIKAQEIVRNCDNSEVENKVVRLVGFHLLMSFMGTIGSIMAGSGLKELLTIIYAENSVEKIMSGHAYSRAVRAHVLVHLVLAELIWESVDLSEDEAVMMENALNDMDPSVVLNIEENELLKVVSTKFRQALYTFESRGPTAKLWVQYFSMVTLIKQFIETSSDHCPKNAALFSRSWTFLLCKMCTFVLPRYVDLGKQNGFS
ncbi:hypothetical protein AVEN_21120-1 [Araneus ventricosus]|uniref:Uncharacterized protein n=1 Tax=Araneus ventricosus TaxID=182803 RepID=A0A4Y1ZKN2_ARAVE|nr:hypothetical protein AVEN_21120-1 [Araneus ventricosus]